jgi:enoyl-CoA hydratase/carnithine racemase
MSTILCEDRDRLRRIVLARPDKANALSADMMLALAAAIRDASDVDLVTISGRGARGFTAGADIAEFLAGGEKIPPAIAFQLCATGRLLGAKEARDLGLVTDIVPAACFAEAVEATLQFYHERIEAIRIGRNAMRIARSLDLEARFERLAPLMHENFHRPGVRETIARYLKG